MDKIQIIHISTVLCYNSNDEHRPRRILGFAGLQSRIVFRNWRERVVQFWWLFNQIFTIFSSKTFSSPSDTIFEIENLVLNQRNESNSQSWLKQNFFILNVRHEVIKLLKWIDRKAEQYSFIWKILFYCNLL